MTQDLKTFINEELPPDGGWWSDGHEAFEKAAKRMLKAGIGEQEIKEMFADLYAAVTTEYGA